MTYSMFQSATTAAVLKLLKTSNPLSTSALTRRLKTVLLAFSLCLSAVASIASAETPIRVASKIDTEGGLLGNILVQMLESNGLPVENKVSLAASHIVRKALVAGEIDIYPEYTGNGAFFSQTPDDEKWKSHDKGYEAAKAYDAKNHDIIWLTPSPANNTWAIAVSGQLAKENQLKTLTDFAKYVNDGGTVKLAGSAEFVDNPLALPSFQKYYGFALDDSQLLILSGGNTAATIQAAATGINGTNAAMAYGTDGAISAAGLVVLDDPKGAQAVYAPAPIVRAETLKAYPQIESILAPVFTSLDRETLQKLNEKIQVMGLPAKKVAHDYLLEKGFIQP